MDRAAKKWFDNCGGWFPRHHLDELEAGIAKGRVNDRDEYGLTALYLAASSGWLAGVESLLRAGADTEQRHDRTGETPLHAALRDEKFRPIVKALIGAGANPDAGNHWGVTPRLIRPAAFRGVPRRKTDFPKPLIQNAEHLADHYYPTFKIPQRAERETLEIGQAVLLCVYGPTGTRKQHSVKVRITDRQGRPPNPRYVAAVETPLEETFLEKGTKQVEFGPEHVASVFGPRRRPKGEQPKVKAKAKAKTKAKPKGKKVAPKSPRRR